VSIHTAWQKSFDFWGTKPIVVESSAGQLTSDSGLLPIHQFDEHIGLTQQFAHALCDPRHEPSVVHSFGQMVRMRVFGILADYPDQNDHDVLRSDLVFKLLAGRLPNSSDLASQPTLSWFENTIDVATTFDQSGYRNRHQFPPNSGAALQFFGHTATTTGMSLTPC